MSRQESVSKRREKTKAPGGCPYMKKCGGCQYIDVPYEVQLAEKQKAMEKLLGKFGKMERILGMDDPYHYRHKVHAVFGYEKGAAISGIYEEKSHRIVKIDRCRIEHEKADEIICKGILYIDLILDDDSCDHKEIDFSFSLNKQKYVREEIYHM